MVDPDGRRPLCGKRSSLSACLLHGAGKRSLQVRLWTLVLLLSLDDDAINCVVRESCKLACSPCAYPLTKNLRDAVIGCGVTRSVLHLGDPCLAYCIAVGNDDPIHGL